VADSIEERKRRLAGKNKPDSFLDELIQGCKEKGIPLDHAGGESIELLEDYLAVREWLKDL
jgi:hypothetical protein